MSRGRSSFGRGAAAVIGVLLALAVLASNRRVGVVQLIVLALAVLALAFKPGSKDTLPAFTLCPRAT